MRRALLLSIFLFWSVLAFSMDFTVWIGENAGNDVDYTSITSAISALAGRIDLKFYRIYEVASVTGTVSDGASVTGQTNSYTATVKHVQVSGHSTRYVAVYHTTDNQFVEDEQLKVSDGNYITLASSSADKGQIDCLDLVVTEAFELDDKPDFDGCVTDADHHWKLTVASDVRRNSGSWQTDKFRIVPTTDGNVVTLADNYTEVSGLQIRPLGSSATSHGFYGAVSYCKVHNNLVDGHNSSYVGNYFANSDYGEIYRNIFYDCNASYVGAFRLAGGGNNKIYYNTSHHCFCGFRTGNSTDIFVGNAFFDSTSSGRDFYDSTGDSTNSGYNVISDTTCVGSNNTTGCDSADNFTNTTDGSQDFSLLSDADCVDAGGSGKGSPYNIDAAGTTVTGTWDAGAFEYTSSGGSTPCVRPIMIMKVPRRYIEWMNG